MNVLIVYAHPEPTSFTGAMRDAAVCALREGGHLVEVSDLHAEGFNPVAGRHDFTTTADPDRFHYQIEQVLYPVRRCMLEYLGLEVPDPFVAYAAPRVDQTARERIPSRMDNDPAAYRGRPDGSGQPVESSCRGRPTDATPRLQPPIAPCASEKYVTEHPENSREFPHSRTIHARSADKECKSAHLS